MPVSAAWHDDTQTVVRLNFHSPWTLVELGEAIRECRTLITSVAHLVDVIWDASEAHTLPQNVITHFLLNMEYARIPANQGAVVVVVNNRFLQSFTRLAKRSLPKITKNMHITDTLPAAEAVIASLREARPR